jgi:hypothetical protein
VITTRPELDRVQADLTAAARTLTAALESATFDEVLALHKAGAALAEASSALDGLSIPGQRQD